MSLVPQQQVLHLYRQMLKAGAGFKDYGFKKYAARRVTQGFAENRSVTDPAQQQQLITKAQQDLKMLQRQALINDMYSPGTYFMDAKKF